MSKPLLPLVRASALIPFIRFLHEGGASVDKYLADANLSPCVAERPEDLLSLHQALQFVERAALGQRLENLGMVVGEKTEIAQLGALGRAIQRSATLSFALATVTETITLYNSGDRIWLVPENDQVLFCHAFSTPGARAAPNGNLFAIMLMIKVVRLATGGQWWPREIRMPMAEASRRKSYEALFPTELVFHGHEAYVLVLERSLLAGSLSRTETRNELRPEDDTEFLRSTAPAPDFGGSVLQAIGGMLRSGFPDIELLANMTGLSVRTFQRRLAKEGTSYSRIVDQARFEAAVRLLRDDGVKVIDIAYELGYTDAGNFTRAFKHWAGVAPREYRHLANAAER